MELFLNLCWLALLLPAYLLWRRRGLLHRSRNASFVFLCTLGCVLVLLFPVISASDDLHAMRPEIEETERAFRHAGHCGCNVHQVTAQWSHSPQLALVGSDASAISFQVIGHVMSAQAIAPKSVPATAIFCRPPPSVA